MHKSRWKLQDAKNHFSQVVNYALTEGPQEVTKRGENSVVVLSYDLYRSLIQPKEDIVDFLQNSPLKGLKLDLDRKKDFPRAIEL